MKQNIEVPGFEERKLTVELGQLFPAPKLYCGGELAPKAEQAGAFLLRRDDGSEANARFQKVSFLDPIPQLVVDGVSYKIAEPLRWYEWVWSGLPLALLVVGGAIGAVIGMLALFANSLIFRQKMRSIAKYGLTALVSASAVVVYLFISVIFLSLINGDGDKPSKVVSDAGRFSVIAPTALNEQVQDISLTKSDIVKMHVFYGAQNDRGYLVSYTDYPISLISQSEPKKILEGARDGASKNTGGLIVSDAEIQLNGYLGRAVSFSGVKEGDKTLAIHARIFLVGTRLYQVMLIIPEGSTINAAGTDFLESFDFRDQ